MITIKNVRNPFGMLENVHIESTQDKSIDAAGILTLLPAAINCFPYKMENWPEIARKAVIGGVTTIFHVIDSPLNLQQIQAKRKEIELELEKVNVPLHFHFYYEAFPESIEELGRYKNEIAAILIPKSFQIDDPFIDRIFQVAAQEDCMVAYICDNQNLQKTHHTIELVEKYSNQLLLLNISDPKEIHFLKEAKKRELLIYAAALIAGNSEEEFLWEAMHERIIDLITSNTESYLPLMLDRNLKNKISLEEIVALTRSNAEKIFDLRHHQDASLVDMKELKKYEGKELIGWPRYTIINGVVQEIEI